MALGLGGNAVTVSTALWAPHDRPGRNAGLRSGNDRQGAQAGHRDRRASLSEPMLRFAVVHPYSGHNYELRYWLAACGIDPARDVEIVIVPPPLMADALAAAPSMAIASASRGARRRRCRVRAHCHGKSRHLALEPGEGLEYKRELGRRRARGAGRACCAPCAAPRSGAPSRSNRARAGGDPLRQGVSGTSGRMDAARIDRELDAGGGDIRRAEDFFVPFAKAATFPWKSHALWFYSQMVRWGQVQHTRREREHRRARRIVRIFIAVRLTPLGVALPAANAKVEGALLSPTPVGSAGASLTLGPDGFFDGSAFRSRQARRVHRRPEALAAPHVQCTNFAPRAPANGYSLVLRSPGAIGHQSRKSLI